METCAVAGCKRFGTITDPNDKVSFHYFPKRRGIKQKWIRFCGREKTWTPTRSSLICSDHFTSEYFDILPNNKRMLDDHAIPTLNYRGAVGNSVLPTIKIITNTSSVEPVTLRALYSIDIQQLGIQVKRPTSSLFKNESPYSTEYNGNSENRNSSKRKPKCELTEEVKKPKYEQRKNTLNSVRDILEVLKLKFKMPVEDLNILEYTNVTKEELVGRRLKHYSLGMRSFTFTLYYFSPKAYIHVRKHFQTVLPTSRRIQLMYFSKDGEPGFTKESFAELKYRASCTDLPVLATLVIGEMSLRRCIEIYNNQIDGLMDVGTGSRGDHLPEAKEVLVFLVHAINYDFNVPVGYFFLDKITGYQRAELVKTCLTKVHINEIKIVALSCKGSLIDLEMAESLGCSFKERIVKFEHPYDNSPVILMFDSSYMVKLISQTFRLYKVFLDKEGKRLKWHYIEELRKFNNDLYKKYELGASICSYKHIRMEKMKSSLHNPFTSWVVDTMQYCSRDLKLASFMDSEPTQQFLNVVNNIIVLLSFKGLGIRGIRHVVNEECIHKVINPTIDYISELRTESGTLLTRTSQKTGPLGLLAYLEALKHLIIRQNAYFNDYSIYLPITKINLRPLELFLYNLKRKCRTDRPTARQFKYEYNLFLSDLEEINVLNSTPAIVRINKTSVYGDGEDRHSESLNNKVDGEVIKVIRILNNPFEYRDEVFTYAVTIVVKYLIKKIVCDECTEVLTVQANAMVYASEDVLKICKISESIIKTYKREFRKRVLVSLAMRQLIGAKLFDKLEYHQLGVFLMSNHVTDLMKAVVEEYIELRLFVQNVYIHSV